MSSKVPTLTNAEMASFIEGFFEEIRRIRAAGQAEYAHDDANVFANFDRIASALGQTREEVMMTYALKHVDGIVAWVRGHKSQREGVEGRIVDLIMYMLLLAASAEAREGGDTPLLVDVWASLEEDSAEEPIYFCSLCGFAHAPSCDELHGSGSRRAELLQTSSRRPE